MVLLKVKNFVKAKHKNFTSYIQETQKISMYSPPNFSD